MLPVSSSDRLSYITDGSKVSHYLIGEVSKNVTLPVSISREIIANKDYTYFAETSRCDNLVRYGPDT